MKKSITKVSFATAGLALLALIAVFVAACGIAIYGFGYNGRTMSRIAGVIPFPAVISGSGIITIHSVENNLAAVKKFYENQDFSATGMRVDFSTADGQKRLLVKKKNLLNKMIDNAVIEKLAAERGIKLTEELVAQEVSRKLNEAGNKAEIAENLQKLYGWNMAEFSAQIVKPDLYREKLMADVRATDNANVEAKEKIKRAAEEIAKGKSFEDAAKEFSDGESAKNGGNLGWFSAEQLLPQLTASAFALKDSEVSPVIESDLGFHILKLNGKKTENGTELVNISQIIARTTDFPNWLINQEKNTKIFIPLKSFHWNNDLGEVEFTDEELKKFEEELDKNSGGDISVLF